MKLRVLSYGVDAKHGSITRLGSLSEPISISDFDAFFCDLQRLSSEGVDQGTFERRKFEIHALLQRKGGIVICFLSPDGPVSTGFVNRYALLSTAAPRVAGLVQNFVRYGEGSRLKILRTKVTASSAYFQVLQSAVRFRAHLMISDTQVAAEGGTTLATDSADYPVAAEFAIGEGRLCLLPEAIGISPERLGAAALRVIEAHFNKTAEVEAPSWAADSTVPGADAHDEEITDLVKRSEELALRIEALKGEREDLMQYVRLLFGYGKAVLEPTVRSALRVIGFEVPEPDQYAGEWDVELRDPESGGTALGEVEGSDGPIDVDKYRQLLDYVDGEVLEGRQHKGILIGNGYRQLPPDAPERQNQFSDHAQRGATRNNFCLLPTTELFKAVCAVLSRSADQNLKKSIRESLLSTTATWRFTENKHPENQLIAPGVTS
jgi:hypothetical protein